jgi:OFA family oxalate/formate antiporter-like MFS transporter
VSLGQRAGGKAALAACAAAIFWPGAFAFGFPGVMAATWRQSLAAGRAEVGAVMFFMLAALGCFMFLAGRWQVRLGSARLILVGAALGAVDMTLAAFAGSVAWIWAWAFAMGASQCLVYISCLTTVQRWFPARRGLVVGLVNLAFAGGAAVMSPVFAWLLAQAGYAAACLLSGAAFLLTGFLAAPFADTPEHRGLAPAAGPGAQPAVSLAPGQAAARPAFWLLWTATAFMGAGGIAMVTLAPGYGLELGLSLERAVVILTAFNLGSGGSRLAMGWLSDVVPRTKAMSWAYAAAGAAYLLLPWTAGLAGPALLAAVVGIAFGTQFAVSAPLVVDCFGPERFGEVFGLVFTAYGFLSGLLGPALGGWLLDAAGGYALVFSYLGCLCLAAAALIRLVKPAV